MGMQEREHQKVMWRINARKFKQVEGVHYDGSSTHAPVTNAGTIRIVLILMIMADWQGQIVDEAEGMGGLSQSSPFSHHP